MTKYDKKIYMIIPFTEVKDGQSFEDVEFSHEFTEDPWVRLSETVYCCLGDDSNWDYADKSFTKGCLVKVADMGSIQEH
jgi:hypothetical protein